jgi:hypothetical protein
VLTIEPYIPISYRRCYYMLGSFSLESRNWRWIPVIDGKQHLEDCATSCRNKSH